MPAFGISRRTLGAGMAGAAVIAGLARETSATAAAGGTWLDMVKTQHAMIADTFDKLIAAPGPAARAPLLKKLGYLLTAHSVAEENVLYPAIAMQGMTSDSDRLYIEQAHAKVGNAELNKMARMGSDPGFVDKVRALTAAVLHHAKDEEEADIFPKLMHAMDTAGNARLTTLYREQFESVKPV